MWIYYSWQHRTNVYMMDQLGNGLAVNTIDFAVAL